MKHSSELSAVVRRAETLLVERTRAQNALAKAQLDFREALARHAKAESRLELAIGRAAVDDTGDPAAERGAVAEALGAVSVVGERVSGLKAMLQQDSQIQAAADQLQPLLVSFGAEVQAEFLDEYSQASEAWGKVLGKRQAIEALLGVSIPAPIPQPAEHIFSNDLTRPTAAANGLKAALDAIAQGQKEIETWRRRRPEVTAVAERYQVIKPILAGNRTYTPGEIIAGSELEPGAIALYTERRALIAMS